MKPIGTVTETIDAIGMCRQAGWAYVISHRSGGSRVPSWPTLPGPWPTLPGRRPDLFQIGVA
ncbi:hypothetical protein [Roseomonas genomospecies 6]|uniref:hypothetical protein n=1 Tax=Roseomonas genomospecies 6 TaxID=214106 RepID=UPI00336A6250